MTGAKVRAVCMGDEGANCIGVEMGGDGGAAPNRLRCRMAAGMGGLTAPPRAANLEGVLGGKTTFAGAAGATFTGALLAALAGAFVGEGEDEVYSL